MGNTQCNSGLKVILKERGNSILLATQANVEWERNQINTQTF
jgi:hypothetical protein